MWLCSDAIAAIDERRYSSASFGARVGWVWVWMGGCAVERFAGTSVGGRAHSRATLLVACSTLFSNARPLSLTGERLREKDPSSGSHEYQTN